jgi:zinc protease
MTRHRFFAFACALLTASGGCEKEGEETLPSGPLVFPVEPFRDMQPAVASPRPFEAPMPEVFTLASGVEVVLVERHAVPVVRFNIVFPVGYLGDPKGKEGLSGTCTSLMFQASHSLDRAVREQTLADVSATVEVGVNAYEFNARGECLSPDLDTVVPIWADLFLDPALDPGTFGAVVRGRSSGLGTAPSLIPAAIAARVSSRLFWGTDHPFVRELTAESLAAATVDDCRAFVASLRPQGARLFVSGDITRAEIEAKFGSKLVWRAAPAGLVPPLPEAPPPASATGSVFFVDAPGAPQSIITLRSPGPARGSSEYFSAQIMAAILAGDSISSRIGMNVREMRGYAYSLAGGFAYDKNTSYFSFSAPVVKDATAESVFEVLEEIRKMREQEVTDEELARERDGLVAGLPYSFETGGGMLGNYTNLAFFGLPFTYYRTFAASYAAVTRASVRQAAETYLRPGTLQILVVGDGAAVLPKLRELAVRRPDLMGRDVVSLDPRGNRL